MKCPQPKAAPVGSSREPVCYPFQASVGLSHPLPCSGGSLGPGSSGCENLCKAVTQGRSLVLDALGVGGEELADPESGALTHQGSPGFPTAQTKPSI